MSEGQFESSPVAALLRGPVYVIGLGKAEILRLSAYGVLLAFLAAGVFTALTQGAGSGPTSTGWLRPLLYVATYFGVVVAHELVHGLFFRIFGGRPRYGAGVKYLMPYFYATSPGDVFSVHRMIVVGLAPLLVISPLALFGGLLVPAFAGYLAVVFIGNTAGAVGDMWMTSRLVKFLSVPDATVADLRDGMAVHSTDPRARDIADALAAAEKRPAGFIVHWMGAAMAVLAAQVLAGLIGPILTESLLIGPAQFPLLAFERSGSGLAMTLNVVPALLAGLVFATAARQLSRRSLQGAE